MSDDDDFAAWMEGLADGAAEERLAARLRDDPSWAQERAAEARIAGTLAALLGGEVAGCSTADSVLAQLGAASASRARLAADRVVARLPRRRRAPARLGWVGLAAALAAGLMLALWWQGAATVPAPAFPDPVVAARAEGIDLRPDPAARISRGDDAAWELATGQAELVVSPRAAGVPAVRVRTAHAEVVVVGTRFSVLAEPATTRVAVAEGVVEVHRRAGGRAVRLPPGGVAEIDATGLLWSWTWAGGAAPSWLAIGAVETDLLVARTFPDPYGTLGLDCRPLAASLTAASAVEMEVRLDGGAPTVELWWADEAGGHWVLEEVRPPQGTWLQRRIAFGDCVDDATRSRHPLPGTRLKWLHLSTRDAPGRRLEIRRLAFTGLAP